MPLLSCQTQGGAIFVPSTNVKLGTGSNESVYDGSAVCMQCGDMKRRASRAVLLVNVRPMPHEGDNRFRTPHPCCHMKGRRLLFTSMGVDIGPSLDKYIDRAHLVVRSTNMEGGAELAGHNSTIVCIDPVLDQHVHDIQTTVSRGQIQRRVAVITVA